jgi:hypothetical protein
VPQHVDLLEAPSRGTSHSVDLEGLRHITQRASLMIVRTLRSGFANDDCPVVAVGNPHATRAPHAPLNIDLAAARTEKVTIGIFDEFNRSHAFAS